MILPHEIVLINYRFHQVKVFDIILKTDDVSIESPK